MKKILLILFILLCAALPSAAQTGLEINKIFNGRFSSDPAVTETLLSGSSKILKKNKLTVFATFKGPAANYRSEVEKAVLADGASAIGKNVRYKEGKLYYALFILRPVKAAGKTLNRYLYYLNNSANKGANVMVAYLEGTLNEQEVSALISSLANKEK